MEQTKQTRMEAATWDDAALHSYLKFEEGIRRTYAIQNYELNWVIEPNYDKTAEERQVRFTCDVVAKSDESGEKFTRCNEKISLKSKRFIAAIRPHLEGKSKESIIFLSIKQIGKDTTKNFDIESRKPVALV